MHQHILFYLEFFLVGIKYIRWRFQGEVQKNQELDCLIVASRQYSHPIPVNRELYNIKVIILFSKMLQTPLEELAY